MNRSSSSAQADACDIAPPCYRKPLWLGVGAAVTLAVLLLAVERAESYWPYLILLTCPLMHLLMCRRQKQETSTTPTRSGAGQDR